MSVTELVSGKGSVGTKQMAGKIKYDSDFEYLDRTDGLIYGVGFANATRTTTPRRRPESEAR
jgi:hypothetical protein